MDVCGKLIVFCHKDEKSDKLNFSTSVSRKEKDGSYTNKSMTTFFIGDLKEKAQKLKDSTRYELDEVVGFISVYKEYFQLNISQCKIVASEKFEKKEPAKKATKATKKKESTSEVDDEELPF